MSMFLVFSERSGPKWRAGEPLEAQSDWLPHKAFMNSLVDDGIIVLGGPLDDGHRVAFAVEAASAEAIEATFADDPWTGSHLRIVSITPWDVRLDGRTSAA
ncbi:hypothetical protein [Plantactinospora sonchi]|uniref:YCII-related domain-containing protein n=1 Tax=Plantactinospora sonchi TaxID=1544735 RepID=A0ABU7RS99_9ACTN